jgi:hypothetical protein
VQQNLRQQLRRHPNAPQLQAITELSETIAPIAGFEQTVSAASSSANGLVFIMWASSCGQRQRIRLLQAANSEMESGCWAVTS